MHRRSPIHQKNLVDLAGPSPFRAMSFRDLYPTVSKHRRELVSEWGVSLTDILSPCYPTWLDWHLLKLLLTFGKSTWSQDQAWPLAVHNCIRWNDGCSASIADPLFFAMLIKGVKRNICKSCLSTDIIQFIEMFDKRHCLGYNQKCLQFWFTLRGMEFGFDTSVHFDGFYLFLVFLLHPFVFILPLGISTVCGWDKFRMHFERRRRFTIFRTMCFIE